MIHKLVDILYMVYKLVTLNIHLLETVKFNSYNMYLLP